MKVYSGIHTAAADLPVELEDFKAFVRQYSDHEDSMLESILAGAVGKVEGYIQQSMEQQSRIAYLNGTPPRLLELDMGPVTAITSVKYRQASDGTLVTMDPDDYILENDTLYPAGLQNWPAVTQQVLGGFQVIYTAGHADHTVSPIVELNKQLQTGIFLMAQAIYHKREDCEKAAYCILDTLRVGQGV